VIPGGLAALLVLLAFVPGWLYLTWAERMQPTPRRTGLHELLEVVAIGVGTTGPAILLMILIPHEWLPFTVDLQAWADKGPEYLSDHLDAAAITLLLIGGLALSFAFAIYWFGPRRRAAGPEFHQRGNVWTRALATRPEGELPWVGLSLIDGTLVEGVLHSMSLHEGEDRDIAIATPIRVTPVGGEPLRSPVARLVVPAREIRHISVINFPEA
jgi:hypothetical protein